MLSQQPSNQTQLEMDGQMRTGQPLVHLLELVSLHPRVVVLLGRIASCIRFMTGFACADEARQTV